MGAERISIEVKEARENLAQIMDMLEGTAHWCAQNAYPALSALCERWEKVCSQPEPIEWAVFRAQCEDLLGDCNAFQTYVYRAGCEFRDRVENRLAHLEEFKGKDTWFLRLNPASIREVIFGLYTDKSLKSDIRKLIERQDLQHVKLYQAEESETYNLNLE